MKRHLKPVFALILMLLVGGCGQVGPLFLPEESPPPVENSNEEEETDELNDPAADQAP